MKDNSPPVPNLPAMTTHERKIWAASHRLPADMLLVSVGEMLAMREAFDACAREVNLWRQLGKIYMGAELPELFEPALRAYMAEKERLEKEAKPLFQVDMTGSKIVQFPPSVAKVSASTRPQEV